MRVVRPPSISNRLYPTNAQTTGHKWVGYVKKEGRFNGRIGDTKASVGTGDGKTKAFKLTFSYNSTDLASRLDAFARANGLNAKTKPLRSLKNVKTQWSKNNDNNKANQTKRQNAMDNHNKSVLKQAENYMKSWNKNGISIRDSWARSHNKTAKSTRKQLASDWNKTADEKRRGAMNTHNQLMDKERKKAVKKHNGDMSDSRQEKADEYNEAQLGKRKEEARLYNEQQDIHRSNAVTKHNHDPKKGVDALTEKEANRWNKVHVTPVQGKSLNLQPDFARTGTGRLAGLQHQTGVALVTVDHPFTCHGASPISPRLTGLGTDNDAGAKELTGVKGADFCDFTFWRRFTGPLARGLPAAVPLEQSAVFGALKRGD